MKSALLVIGGGPAGTMAATTLAAHGCEVLLVERELKTQHKVCGEFLSQEALHYLRAMDIEPEKFGAVTIRAVRLIHGSQTIESALPFEAMSLTRCRLDKELLRIACAKGAKILQGCNVESLRCESGEWRAKFSNADAVLARNVFVATGKHDLRGQARPPGKQRGMIALKMYWKLHPSQHDAIREHVELIAYHRGYAGFQPVEDSVANLCCLVEAEEYQRVGGSWTKLLGAICDQSPHLRARLQGAEPLLEKPLAIASLPYGMLRQQTIGLWHLGDQAAVIPSFTGDGMSLALHSGKLAAETFLAGGTAQDFQHRFAEHVSKQVSFATTLSKSLIDHPKLAFLAMRFWPGALRLLAEKTRIRAEHLLFEPRAKPFSL